MWEEWLNRFVLYMQKRNFSQKTIKDYSCDLLFFFRYLDSESIKKISQVTKEVLNCYQTHLYYYEKKGKKLSFDTQRHKLSAVRSFFCFMVKSNYFLFNPASDIDLPRKKKILPRGIMSIGEMQRVLKTASGVSPLILRDRAILEVLYSTGIRNTELRCLSIFDVDLDNQQVRIRYGKGQKERIVPLGECASQSVKRYLKEARPHFAKDPAQVLLFVSINGKQINSSNLVWIVKKYIRKAKLDKSITPHCFRHTCASHMLKGRADLRHIQEMLGHSSVQTTQIYTKVVLTDLKEVHKRCHPREKMGFTR